MSSGVFTSPHFFAFLVASLILAITPGPGVVYVLTQTLSQGRRAGLASVGGIAVGNLGNASAASVGLAAIFAVSSVAFIVIKLLGAAYLVLLGFRALSAETSSGPAADAKMSSPVRLFLDGLLVAFFNPKTALFFAALLPQFMDLDSQPLSQSLVLGCVFVAIAVCTDTVYVLTASLLTSVMPQRSKWRRYGKWVSASSFFGLGLYAAFGNPRPSK